jgi:thiol:disulfide interchange protein
MLMADWTHDNPEIDLMLEKFRAEQIPLLAIFPAGRPNQPIVLSGGYTQKMLLEKLKEAGNSL